MRPLAQDEDRAYDNLRQRTLDAEMFDEPRFTLQHQGESKPSAPQSLSTMLDANSDDADVCDWLKRARVGGCLVVGGGAAPAISLRRVA